MVAFICVPESWCPGFSWDSGSWSSTVCHASTRCGVECLHSAQGKVTVAGLFNWSPTLQQVGVPSAILCLWGVQDSGACKFMSILYNHLTSKVPIGLALRKAMIAMIDDGDNWEPKHWVSYSMVGVPHVQLPGFEY